MGKGDWKRPIQDHKAFEDNWNRIFGKRKTKDGSKTDQKTGRPASRVDPNKYADK
jgi:hypothetical protein